MRRTLVLALSVLLACGASKKSDEAEPADQDAPADDPGGLGSLGLMGSLLSNQLDQPGRYDDPLASDDYRDGEPHTAVIELAGEITELRSFSLLGGNQGLELRALTDRIGELAAEGDVLATLVRFGELGIDLASAEELREALGRLAAVDDGEPRLICHVESASTVTYYVMTVCDRILLAPGGSLMLTGIAALPIHLKGLLDKLSIHADFLHVGAYKGAAEPLTRDAPSPEATETIDAILDESYQTLVAGIAEGRSLDSAVVRQRIDRALFQGAAAVDAGLVDEIMSFDDVRLARAPWRAVALKASGGVGDVMQMLGLVPKPPVFGKHLALVYAVGNVIDGKGGGLLAARGEIASRTLVAALRRLADDDSVAGVVVRVSSPGGSALASEQIAAAIRDLAAFKPVVVSMGGVAASGGYYISTHATRIFADRNTLTGSIGVVGGKLAVDDALADVGVRTFPRGRGKRALMMASMGRWSADERAAMQTLMQATYDLFTTRVQTGRKLSAAEVEKVAQGRVWTGAAARDRRLVDEIGGLDAALAQARELAGVDAEIGIEVYPPEPTLVDIVRSFGNQLDGAPLGSRALLGELARTLGPDAVRVVELVLGQLTLLAQAPVQTALWFPVVLR